MIYTSPIDSEEDLIARIVQAAATFRQQPGIFERTRVVVGCASRNICSKLVRFFFLEYFSGFTRFPTLIRPTLTGRSPARTRLRHSSLTIHPCFGHPNHVPKFGHGVFRTFILHQNVGTRLITLQGARPPRTTIWRFSGFWIRLGRCRMQDKWLMLQYMHPKVIQRTLFHNKWIRDVSACLRWPCLLCLIICDHACTKRYFTYGSCTGRHHICEDRGFTSVLWNHTVQCDGLFYCWSLHIILMDLILYMNVVFPAVRSVWR
jgi:hypothetical protein